MKINYYSIAPLEIKFELGDLSDADLHTFKSNDIYREHAYSFTTIRPIFDGRLCLGVTSIKNRILWMFDPLTGEFTDLGYQKIGGEYDVKVHRSLDYDVQNNCLYGVASGLHREDEYSKAPGAAIFRYDLNSNSITALGIPIPHEYTQTTVFDSKRRLLYGFTYHTFSFYAFNVDDCETVYQALPGSISHISAIDDYGCVWSTWGRDTHFLYKYDPQINDIVWMRTKFPEGGKSYMYPGAGPIDCMLNGGDGYLYVALEVGSLVRLDPLTAEIEYLGRPSVFPRMPALTRGGDGLLFGTCGDDWNVSVFTYDIKNRSFKIIADLKYKEERCFRPHDIAVVGSKIYVGETDNPVRPGYLWEVNIENG